MAKYLVELQANYVVSMEVEADDEDQAFEGAWAMWCDHETEMINSEDTVCIHESIESITELKEDK